MPSQNVIQFDAHLAQGKEKIPVVAKYASRFSLLVRFVNGTKAGSEALFEKLVFDMNGKQLSLGPCQYLSEKCANGYQGRIVFSKDVYDLKSLFYDNKMEKLQTEFLNLPLVLAHKDKIKKRFKEFVANLTYDLNVYKTTFDELDAKFANEPDIVREHVQKIVIETEGKNFLQFLDDKLFEFENIIINYSKKENERHGYYLRKQIWNFILCSRFMARTNLKPRGYSGDSEMMRLLYDNEYVGLTTFEKLMHKHPIEHAAAQAVRNRRQLIANMLKKLNSGKTKPRGEKIRVLSAACGPAFELQDVLQSKKDCQKYHFTLLDQDKKALAEAAGVVAQLEKKWGVSIEVDYLTESVRTMLTTRQLEKTWGEFDFIYSMGLFDYLTPPVAKAVIEKLFKLIKVNGEMVIGNFHISNPSRGYMEYWLDWVLYYRTEQEFIDLLKESKTCKSSVFFEDTGSQMFLHVKKLKP